MKAAGEVQHRPPTGLLILTAEMRSARWTLDLAQIHLKKEIACQVPNPERLAQISEIGAIYQPHASASLADLHPADLAAGKACGRGPTLARHGAGL